MKKKLIASTGIIMAITATICTLSSIPPKNSESSLLMQNLEAIAQSEPGGVRGNCALEVTYLQNWDTYECVSNDACKLRRNRQQKPKTKMGTCGQYVQ